MKVKKRLTLFKLLVTDRFVRHNKVEPPKNHICLTDISSHFTGEAQESGIQQVNLEVAEGKGQKADVVDFTSRSLHMLQGTEETTKCQTE
jgi:hypothetical protein